MADTRNEFETHRRGLSSDEIQKLSKREMKAVEGGYYLSDGDMVISSAAARESRMEVYGWNHEVVSPRDA